MYVIDLDTKEIVAKPRSGMALVKTLKRLGRGNHPPDIHTKWSAAELRDIGVIINPKVIGARYEDAFEDTQTREYFSTDYDTVVIEYQRVERNTDRVKQTLLNKVRRMFQSVAAGGTEMQIGGRSVVIATSHEARQEIAAARAKTADGTIIPAVTRSGEAIEIEEQTAIAMLEAVDAHRAAAMKAEYDLTVEINAATTLDQLRAIDIEGAAWPPLPQPDDGSV